MKPKTHLAPQLQPHTSIGIERRVHYILPNFSTLTPSFLIQEVSSRLESDEFDPVARMVRNSFPACSLKYSACSSLFVCLESRHILCGYLRGFSEAMRSGPRNAVDGIYCHCRQHDQFLAPKFCRPAIDHLSLYTATWHPIITEACVTFVCSNPEQLSHHGPPHLLDSYSDIAILSRIGQSTEHSSSECDGSSERFGGGDTYCYKYGQHGSNRGHVDNIP